MITKQEALKMYDSHDFSDKKANDGRIICNSCNTVFYMPGSIGNMIDIRKRLEWVLNDVVSVKESFTYCNESKLKSLLQ